MQLLTLENGAADLGVKPVDVLRTHARGELEATYLPIGEGPRSLKNYRITPQSLTDYVARGAPDLKLVESLFNDREMERAAESLRNALYQAVAAVTPDATALAAEKAERTAGRDEIRHKFTGELVRSAIAPMNSQQIRASGFFDRTLPITPEMKTILTQRPTGVAFDGNMAELGFVQAMREEARRKFTARRFRKEAVMPSSEGSGPATDQG